MSRFVRWGDKLWERAFFDPPPNLPPGTCAWCGGLGVVPEQIDEDRYDVAVACPSCRTWCPHCHAWVQRANHQCHEAKP